MAAYTNPELIDKLTAVVGPKNVLTNQSDLYVYSFDSALDRALPSFVVIPRNRSELIKVLGLLTKYKHAYVARGAATSLCGGPIPLGHAAVVSLAFLKTIGHLNTPRNTIKVEPGVVNLRLQEAISKQGLFYAPDPGSQKACTLGGNIATNAGGPHCLKYGVTSDSIVGLEVFLPNGKLVTFNVSDPGFDLTGLFVGSEGTLGIVTQATLQLLPKPKFVKTMIVSFHSIEESIQAVTDIISAGILPATLEAMDKTVVAAVEAFMAAGYPLEAEAVLLIELDGEEESVLENDFYRIKDVCAKNNCGEFRFARDEEERKRLWEGRRGSYAAMARLAPNVLVEDGAVPRTRLPEALKRIKEIAGKYNLSVALLFHAGDGNLHPQIIFDERDEKATQIVKRAGYEMLRTCVELGGTISGEHGIGMDKKEAMKWLFTRDTLNLFRRIKNALDPLNVCNPDKLLPLVSKSMGESPAKEHVQAEISKLGVAEPKNEEELVELVRLWGKELKKFGIRGTASRFKVQENAFVNLHHLNQIVEHDKGNLTVRAQAGVNLVDLRQAVEAHGQYLWVAGEGTVGGAIATRASLNPPLRNQILAVRFLLSSGELIEVGANTMKNVAGYDVAKLLIGSWGTLGLIIDVTFRLFPYPAQELIATDARPFQMNEWHKLIKKVFDPHNLFCPRASMLTEQEIQEMENKQNQPQQEPLPQQEGNTGKSPDIDRYGDGFWT